MLHIVKTPHQIPSVLAYLADQDAVILVEDSIYAINEGHFSHFLLKNCPASVFFLSNDALARGLTLTTNGYFQGVDFEGFVELTVAHEQSITWE